MAKASVEKVPKVSKKKSQDLKADAPPKTKKIKPVNEEAVPPPADPPSSKPKKEKKKKAEEPVKEAEELEVAKKEKKKAVEAEKVEDEAIEADAKAKVGKKAKGKAVEVEDEGVEVTKATKKKRKNTAVKDIEEALLALKTKKSTSTPVIEEPPSSPDKRTPGGAAKEKAKAKGIKVAGPEPEAEEDDAKGNEVEEEFYGFESDDDDSSDEEVDDFPGIDLGKLPTIAKDDATVKRKLEKAKRKPVRCPSLSIQRFVSFMRAFLPTDRRQGCTLPRPYTPRILRGPDEGVLLAVRQCYPHQALPKQKGAQLYCIRLPATIS